MCVGVGVSDQPIIFVNMETMRTRSACPSAMRESVTPMSNGALVHVQRLEVEHVADVGTSEWRLLAYAYADAYAYANWLSSGELWDYLRPS